MVNFTYALQQQSRSTDQRRSPATRLLVRWVPFLEVRAAMLSEGVLCVGSHFAGK